MKSGFENSVQGTSDWKLFLKSAEILLKKNSLQEQSSFLTRSIEEIFQLKAQFWFAHPLFPLPGEETPDMVDSKADLNPLVMTTFADHISQFRQISGEVVSAVSVGKNYLEASLPLLCEKDLLGIVLVKPIGDRLIDAQTFLRLVNFLSLCAMPIQIYRLTVLKNWRVEQLAIVRKVSDRIANITNLDYLCEQVTDAVREKFHYYFVAIYTCEKDDVLLCRSSSSANQPARQAPRVEVSPGQGIVGWVADHKDELYIEDVCQHPTYRFHESLPETQSEAAFPLMVGDRLLGVLDVQSDILQAFHEMDLVVLRTMADNVAIAVEGAHLFSGLQRQTEQISTVFDISRALSSILDLDVLLDEVAKTIQQKYRYLQVNVFTVHKGRGKIIYRAGTGERSQAYRDSYLTFNIQDPAGILPWVAREAKTFLSNDVIHEPQYRVPDFLPSTARSEISVPLIAAGEVVGILDIQSDRVNAFDEYDTFFFEALSAGIATSIRNATLFRSEQFRRQVAESVRDIAGILSNGSSVEEFMNRILEKLQESLPCDAASIWLTSPDKNDEHFLTLAAIQGINADKLTLAYQTKETAGLWIQETLKSEEPNIRSITDSKGPLGEALGLPDDYSAIAAPLRAGGETVGILTLAHHQPDRYGSEARLITQTFAGYAAAAIQNNRLYASVREQAWVSAVLLKVAEANKNSRSLNDLTENTVRLIPELIGCSTCAVYYFNQPLKIYERKATNGFPNDSLPARCFNIDQAAFRFASKLLTPVPAYYSHGEFCLSPVRDVPAGVILPLAIRDQVLGMIWVGNSSEQKSLSQETIQVLTGISNQIATAIENLQLLELQQQDAFIAAALLQVAQTVSSQDTLQTILDSILNLLSILAGIKSAAFFLKAPGHNGFLPVESFIGLDGESTRSMGTRLFPGDFPLLDLVTDRNIILLAPFNEPPRSADQWTIVKQIIRVKDAAHQKPPDGGWLVGIPLSGKGEIFGALIILENSVSGNLLEKRLDLLTGIGRQAALAIQNDQLQDEKLEKERLQQEFQFARDIQQTFLPRQIPSVKGWNVASLWQPAYQVGGDFFDFFLPRPNTFCAVIADVSDKGMPAALYMTVTRTLIRSFAQEDLTPGQILKKVNDLLLQDNPTGMFVTVTIIVGSSQSGTIHYANAGHNPTILRTKDMHLTELPRGQIALGVLENQEYQDHTIETDPDSFLILYTDGVTDTVSPGGEYYALQGLTRLLSTNKFHKADILANALDNDLMQFRAGADCVDDVTVLVLHRL